MKRIGIIGSGFTGTMTAVQLIKNAAGPVQIFLINERETLGKGIAYNPYSEQHILNVVTARMSAYPDKPDHFLDWVMDHPQFADKDRTLIANSYISRKLYGEYLTGILRYSLSTAAARGLDVRVFENFVVDLDVDDSKVQLLLDDDNRLEVDYCVIATGNQMPGNPTVTDPEVFQSPNYFRNPWTVESVSGIKSDKPVLIIGNGLTMVDTVIGLLEQGFKGEIHSISPNGFNILPHRHNGLKYSKLSEELTEQMSLSEIVALVLKHVRLVRDFGVSAEPVIDSLRPHTQRIWKSLTPGEKRIFMSRFRHLWGVARHRIPLHVHDKIQQLRVAGILHIRSGRICDMQENGEGVLVKFHDKRSGREQEQLYSRVINCTGPETDLMKVEGSFLKHCLLKGILIQDELKLGVRASTDTYNIMSSQKEFHHNLFTAGSNLKGELWESTAVNELRIQAEKLARHLLNLCSDGYAKKEPVPVV